MFIFFFFFKQKTAYEMRISDWSSDVCSSDLSTLLAADRGIAAISIESDARYARQVREALPADLGKYIVTIDIGVTEDWGYPLWVLPTRGTRRRWQRYPLAGPAHLDRLPVFPELVLIDGRFRVASCLAMARAATERAASQIGRASGRERVVQ